MRCIVIGCGGVGSWLVPKLARLEKQILLMDGDILERKNLDRQLFDATDIGKYKAEALADKYLSALGHEWRGEFFSSGALPLDENDLLFCCADNHSARREALEACDLYGCRAIIGCNETTDSEAYFYKADWRGGPHDPRTFYPVILTDHSDDPLRPESCVEVSQTRPQTVLANALAADLMLHLYWAWCRSETDEQWKPVHHLATEFMFRTVRMCDRKDPVVEQAIGSYDDFGM